MTLRNRGEPAGFAKVAAPVMTAAMRRAMRKDLQGLKAILEHTPARFRTSSGQRRGSTVEREDPARGWVSEHTVRGSDR